MPPEHVLNGASRVSGEGASPPSDIGETSIGRDGLMMMLRASGRGQGRRSEMSLRNISESEGGNTVDSLMPVPLGVTNPAVTRPKPRPLPKQLASRLKKSWSAGWTLRAVKGLRTQLWPRARADIKKIDAADVPPHDIITGVSVGRRRASVSASPIREACSFLT